MIDYRLLEALAVVVQEGGFDKAAQRLNLTQSAVSQRIKQLEEQTGQILVARTNPPRTTKPGQQMIKHYRQIRRLEDDLFDSIIPTGDNEFVSLAIGTNRDSLATWLPEAIQDFLRDRQLVLEFRAADQAQTHELMKNGEVMGCISVKPQAMQGCKVEYLGRMEYWLVATPAFASRWFSQGITEMAVEKAPLVCFDRRDEMHDHYLQQILKKVPFQRPVHYVPSTITYTRFIIQSLAYGLLPEQECGPLLEQGCLLNLMPEIPAFVDLYWHCWNLKSALLEDFSRQLVENARQLLITR